MRKFAALLFIISAALVLLPSSVQAADIENFDITNFSTTYYISKNQDNIGTAHIKETITARFPQFDQNHGLRRAIPEVYKKNSLQLKINSVNDENGNTIPYTTKSQNKNLILTMRDDNFVHGEKTYVIDYDVSNIITFHKNNDEWFWDINGDQWGQTIQNVSAAITFDKSIAGSLLPDKKCFTGSNDSQQANCSIVDDEQTKYYVATTEPLPPKQTLSVVFGFKVGTFSKPPVNKLTLIATLAVLIAAFLMPIATIIFMLRRWHKVGRDPKGKGIIIPQYQPPKEINPLLSDVVLHEQMRPLAISASIIDLCIRGYIKVYEVEKKQLFGKAKEYELELVKLPQDLATTEQKIIDMLFSSKTVGRRVNINDQKNKLYTSVKSLQTVTEAAAVQAGYFATAPSQTKKSYQTVSGIGWLVAIGLFIFGAKFDQFIVTIYLSIGVAASAILIGLMSSKMPRKSADGVAIKEHLLGLKEYMKLAEADRIKTLQSPQGAEKTPTINTNSKQQLVKLYEKLLPYAVLFGIEKDWSKQIAPLYDQPPDWYNGTGSFNSAVFVGAVSGISSASANSFSAPSSSGSSGFAGGGAGGGGGGGGGGGV